MVIIESWRSVSAIIAIMAKSRRWRNEHQLMAWSALLNMKMAKYPWR